MAKQPPQRDNHASDTKRGADDGQSNPAPRNLEFVLRQLTYRQRRLWCWWGRLWISRERRHDARWPIGILLFRVVHVRHIGVIVRIRILLRQRTLLGVLLLLASLAQHFEAFGVFDCALLGDRHAALAA